MRNSDLSPTTYIVAVSDADKAVELIRSSIGREDDEITDLGRVSAKLLKALKLEPGDFRSVAEPKISQLQQPLSAA